MFAIYVYNHCNICNVPIYFYNIHMKHLQDNSETIATLKTDTSKCAFKRNIYLLLMKWRLADMWSSPEAAALLPPCIDHIDSAYQRQSPHHYQISHRVVDLVKRALRQSGAVAREWVGLAQI